MNKENETKEEEKQANPLDSVSLLIDQLYDFAVRCKDRGDEKRYQWAVRALRELQLRMIRVVKNIEQTPKIEKVVEEATNKMKLHF